MESIEAEPPKARLDVDREGVVTKAIFGGGLRRTAPFSLRTARLLSVEPHRNTDSSGTESDRQLSYLGILSVSSQH